VCPFTSVLIFAEALLILTFADIFEDKEDISRGFMAFEAFEAGMTLWLAFY
jgi:hypothetical protein